MKKIFSGIWILVLLVLTACAAPASEQRSPRLACLDAADHIGVKTQILRGGSAKRPTAETFEAKQLCRRMSDEGVGRGERVALGRDCKAFVTRQPKSEALDELSKACSA